MRMVLDLIDASDNGDDLIQTEIYPSSNGNYFTTILGPNFDARLVGAVEDDLILLQKSTGEYFFLKAMESKSFRYTIGLHRQSDNRAVLSDFFDQDGDDDMVFATHIWWLA